MTGIENWGYSVILWLQSFSSPAIDQLFNLITFLGDERFFLLLLPLVYWCFDKRLGIRLAVLVMASNVVNIMGKHTFGLPRPSGSVVRNIAHEEGYGFPSGHTQSVTVAFAYLAYGSRRMAAYVAAAILVLAVGLSRMYLGVHFPYDVLGGLVLGMAALALFLWAVPLIERRWLALGRAVRYTVALGVPLLALAVWPLGDTSGSLGALAGFAVGALIEVEQVRFMPAGSPLQRLLRFLVGFVGVAILYFGLKAVLPDGIPWRFMRYASVGLYASVAAPWLFVRLGLAQAEPAPALQPATL